MRSGSCIGWAFILPLLRLLPLAGLSLALGGAGCGSSKSGAEHFVGTWVYAGVLTPNCGTGPAVSPLDLTGYSVVITATDSSHLSVQLGTACTVRFDVDGFTATAQSGQSCTFNLGGALGQQSASITSWTLTSTGTDSITSDFSGSVIICTAAGTGTLTRVGDAGATD